MFKLHHVVAAFATCATPLLAQSIAEHEPNNTPERANSIICGDPVYGTMDAAGGDLDWYRVIVSQPSSMVVDTTTRNTKTQSGNPDNPPSLTDSVVEIWNDDLSTRLARNDDRGDVPSPIRAFMSRARVNVGVGTYYVLVRGFSFAGSQSIGDYVVYVNCLPQVPGCGALTPQPAEVEPNDGDCEGTLTPPATPTPADCCQLHENTLQVSGDVDFYEFTLATPMRVRLETNASTATTGTTRSDTEIWLWDSSCALVENDDDGGTALYSLIDRDLLPGTYWLEVSGFNRGGTGDYQLEISCSPVEVPAGYGYDGTGCDDMGGQTLKIALPRNEWPIIGTWFRLESYGSNLGPSVALVGTPLGPIPLDGIGATGCELSVSDFGAPLAGVPIGPNEQETMLELPADPALIGVQFSTQWVEIDVGANALGVRFSDRLNLSIGEI